MNNHYEPDTDAPDTSKLNEEQLRSRIAELEAQLAQVLDALKLFAMAAKDEDVGHCSSDAELYVYAPTLDYGYEYMTVYADLDALKAQHLHHAAEVYTHLTVKANSA